MNKRVLLVRNAAKRDFGGAETYQVSIAQILADLEWDPIIVTRSKRLEMYAQTHNIKTLRGWWWSQQNWSGVRQLMLPVYIGWLVILTSWYFSLIVRTRADVIHLQSRDDFIAGTAAARLLKRKVVWTDHMDLRYILNNVSQPFRNPAGKLVLWAARFSNHIILISQNEHALVTHHLNPSSALLDKFTIVKNGVIDKYSQYKQHQPTSDRFSYCLASRIVTNKGIGEAIRAFQELERKYGVKNNIYLDIYGGGQDLGKFQLLAEGSSRIVFHGHQSDALEKIALSDVFMLPSYQEGFSIALLEATMLGKVIIASNVDSNPEIIDDKTTGILVPARNDEALTQAMEMAYTDRSLREKLQRNARAKYLAHFNLYMIVKDEILPLYN